MIKNRLLAGILSFAMIFSFTPMQSSALEAPESGSSYILMNIPYEEFYRAELDAGSALGESDDVDGVTSATFNKPRSGSLAGGSYHVNNDGSDITGVIFPVKADSSEMATIASNFTEVTATSSVDITVTNRGQTTTTTYSGKDALFESPSYSFYRLSSSEWNDYNNYKDVGVNGLTLTFGAVQGDASHNVPGAAATLKTLTNSYGDYQITVTGLDSDGGIASETPVSGIELTTTDNYNYGLRHIENIWLKSNIAFSTGFTTQSHGSPLDSSHYESIMGKTIDKITYFTTKGTYTVDVDLYVPIKADADLSVADASVSAESTPVTVTGTGAAIYDNFTCDNTDITYSSGNLVWDDDDVLPGTYTLTANDDVSNPLYADITASFTLSTSTDVAAYNAASIAIEKSASATDADFQNYLSNITSVTVGGVSYTASGNKAVTIVNSDGSIALDAEKSGTAVFTKGSNAVEVNSTGYPALSFNVVRQADGSKAAPYEITTFAELQDINNDPSSSYELMNDLDLSGESIEPIGTATYDELAAMTPANAFSGNFNGNGHKISNISIDKSSDPNALAVGLFGVTSGDGVISDLTIENVSVTGGTNAMAVGGLIGYGMSSGGVDNVDLTGTNSITGTNCVGGLVGGAGTPVKDSSAQNITINIFGDNTVGDDSFSSGRLVQHDVAECGGGIVGGGFGGDVTGCMVTNCTINADSTSNAVEAVGLGGIGGCLQCISDISNNTVNGLTINASGGHAIGGLCGYAGNGNMPSYYGTGCTIAACTVTGLNINAPEATHVGGLVGTNMYFMGMEGQFIIASDCSVAGTITAGTNADSIYGESSPGAIAGRAAGCDVSGTFAGLTINGAPASDRVGVTNCMYESADQDDSLDQTAAGEQLNALFDTYQQLFRGGTFESRCDDYWHDAAAAVVGESSADMAVTMMKDSIGATDYGASLTDPDTFCCDFINGVATLKFNGTEITGYNSAGIELFSHAYKCIGQKNIGEAEGVSGFGGIALESLDGNEDEFKYFLLMPDTPDETYHIEFRYGSDLDELQKYGLGDYANWLAGGIPTSAMNEIYPSDIGKNDSTLRNVIALFSAENLESMTTAETVSQRSDLCGTWDADAATLAILRAETGFPNAKMYCVLESDGTGETYLDLNGSGSYTRTSQYTFFAYDNDNSDSLKSGVYIALSDSAQTAPYKVETVSGNTKLSLFAADGTSSWIKRSDDSGSSGGSGGSGSGGIGGPGSVSSGSGGGGGGTTSGSSDNAENADSEADSSNGENSTSDNNSSLGNVSGFTDVSADAYYADAVSWAVANNITNGLSQTVYGPNQSCTRAQLVTFLWRSYGSPTAESAVNKFTDVSENAYYFEAVRWAIEQGITEGTTPTTFSPDDIVTRRQSVTFLWRAEGKPQTSEVNNFTDVNEDDYAAEAINWAVNAGVSNGVTDTTFAPAEMCTRAQIVTLLYRKSV